jgi:uncharacterized protein YktB (UPF0637 family)
MRTFPLKPKRVWVIFKNSVRTAKKTPHFTITKINWLTLFKEIIAVYTENYTEPINTLCGQNAELLIVKAGGLYSYTRL